MPGIRFDDAPPVQLSGETDAFCCLNATSISPVAADKGWVIIPCELIDYNGEALQALVLRYAAEWQLPQAFYPLADLGEHLLFNAGGSHRNRLSA
ncbi:altronate oxidoreductase [Klebsiella variicola]|nr:altronate oxidoreductase [Klebsiella variicola]